MAASFVLAWAAEAAEVDIAGGLAIAVLAVIAVLPEYAVDLYFAYTAGSRPEYVQFAAANMTGSNRLLLGLGWSLVVLLALFVARRRTGRPVRELVLDPAYRLEIGFLALASLLALVVPATGEIHLWLGLVLLGVFVFYLVRMATSGSDDEPDLVGPAARIGALPTRTRRVVVVGDVRRGRAGHPRLGRAVRRRPRAQRPGAGHRPVPARAVAGPALLRGAGADHRDDLRAARQGRGRPRPAGRRPRSTSGPCWSAACRWPTSFGGGSTSLVLDSRQVEEFALTIAQTLMGIAVLVALRFPRWAAWTLLALFAVQFAVPGTAGRLVAVGRVRRARRRRARGEPPQHPARRSPHRSGGRNRR